MSSHDEDELLQKEEAWLYSGARTFWMWVVLALLIAAIGCYVAYKITNDHSYVFWGGLATAAFFVIGMMISVADDGGLDDC